MIKLIIINCCFSQNSDDVIQTVIVFPSYRLFVTYVSTATFAYLQVLS